MGARAPCAPVLPTPLLIIITMNQVQEASKHNSLCGQHPHELGYFSWQSMIMLKKLTRSVQLYLVVVYDNVMIWQVAFECNILQNSRQLSIYSFQVEGSVYVCLYTCQFMIMHRCSSCIYSFQVLYKNCLIAQLVVNDDTVGTITA